MKTLEKIIASATIGLSLLFPQKLDAKVYDVPVQFNLVNFQTDYLDKAENGDVFNLYQPVNMWGTTAFEGSYSTNKDITINGNGLGFYNGTFTVYDSGKLTASNSFFINGRGNAIDVLNSASIDLNSISLGSSFNTIYFNSIGNLNVNKVEFSEPQSRDTTSIKLEKIAGDIMISQSVFGCSHTGISIGNDDGMQALSSAGSPKLNILNNTFIYNSTSAIAFKDSLDNTIGNVSNNSISDSSIGFDNFKYSGGVIVDKNNLYNNLKNYVDEPEQKLSPLSSTVYNDYYENPTFLNENYEINITSPLYNKGKYITGVTTWFNSPQETYIGSFNPNPIPEPATILLTSLGAFYLLKRKHK